MYLVVCSIFFLIKEILITKIMFSYGEKQRLCMLLSLSLSSTELNAACWSPDLQFSLYVLRVSAHLTCAPWDWLWTFPGVMAFFVLLGFFGLILHCSSLNTNDPRMAGCQNCCYGWGVLDCFPASMEACFALVIVFVVIFAILGIAYGFLAATMAIQKIWQKHYHILTKKELTKVKWSSFCPRGVCVMPSIEILVLSICWL